MWPRDVFGRCAEVVCVLYWRIFRSCPKYASMRCRRRDPPRKGVDLSFLRQLLRFAPRRVVYVSCGADTLARDLRLLVGAGYALTEVQPFDLFPQTRHIETVATLDLAVDAPRQIDAPAEGTREPGRRKRKRQERRRRSTG